MFRKLSFLLVLVVFAGSISADTCSFNNGYGTGDHLFDNPGNYLGSWPDSTDDIFWGGYDGTANYALYTAGMNYTNYGVEVARNTNTMQIWQTGGEWSVTGRFAVATGGSTGTAVGYYQMDGGTLNVGDSMQVPRANTGHVIQTGRGSSSRPGKGTPARLCKQLAISDAQMLLNLFAQPEADETDRSE